ncbi:hypothetical protein HQ609_18180, partial [Rhodococcus corynebacterioides]|nr:hypothetical protein [Rhodococcus corynebacterioides]
MSSSRSVAVIAVLSTVAFVVAAGFLLTRSPAPRLDPAPVVVSVLPSPTTTSAPSSEPPPQPAPAPV